MKIEVVWIIWGWLVLLISLPLIKHSWLAAVAAAIGLTMAVVGVVLTTKTPKPPRR